MINELNFTVISDTHYYSKKNYVDGFDKSKKQKSDQLFFSASEEIVNHTFKSLCENDTPDIILISGDLTYNGEKTSHEEMKTALKKLKQNGKRRGTVHNCNDAPPSCCAVAYFHGSRKRRYVK